jgi:hypothetical protein
VKVIDETGGCLLIGRRGSGSTIAESRLAFRDLMAILQRATITGEALGMKWGKPITVRT